LIEKWKSVENNIKSEINNVMHLAEVCQSFKLIEQPDSKRGGEENNLFLREYLDKRPSLNNNMMQVDKCDKNNEKRWERFGGKPPFAYLNENENDNEEVEFNNIGGKL
jgi:hypothetical protein